MATILGLDDDLDNDADFVIDSDAESLAESDSQGPTSQSTRRKSKRVMSSFLKAMSPRASSILSGEVAGGNGEDESSAAPSPKKLSAARTFLGRTLNKTFSSSSRSRTVEKMSSFTRKGSRHAASKVPDPEQSREDGDSASPRPAAALLSKAQRENAIARMKQPKRAVAKKRSDEAGGSKDEAELVVSQLTTTMEDRDDGHDGGVAQNKMNRRSSSDTSVGSSSSSRLGSRTLGRLFNPTTEVKTPPHEDDGSIVPWGCLSRDEDAPGSVASRNSSITHTLKPTPSRQSSGPDVEHSDSRTSFSSTGSHGVRIQSALASFVMKPLGSFGSSTPGDAFDDNFSFTESSNSSKDSSDVEQDSVADREHSTDSDTDSSMIVPRMRRKVSLQYDPFIDCATRAKLNAGRSPLAKMKISPFGRARGAPSDEDEEEDTV